MRYIITQHYTIEHKELFDLTSPINKKYAENLGFEYIVNNQRRCPERKIWWEKIAWLKELTNSTEDNALIIYEDCDSINLKGDLKLALSTNYGMIQLRGGLGNNQLLGWYNAGVIMLINTLQVRGFLQKVWERNDDTDETSINRELKSKNNLVDGLNICSLDPKWNSWDNNMQHCEDVCIKSWHGIKYEDKLIEIKKFLKTIN